MKQQMFWILAAYLIVAQPRAAGAQGTISGMVRSATTGETLTSVAVSLRLLPRDTGVTRAATVGPSGTFLFDELPPGDYQLTINKSGYRSLSGGAGRITLREDQQLTGLVFSLWPNAAISGRVVDADGEPVAAAWVRAYRIEFGLSDRSLSFAGGDRSDDLGEYRVFDLPAGKYLLRVEPPPPDTAIGRFYSGTAGSFYPGAARPSQALPVAVNWGQDLEAVQLTLAGGPTYSVGGVAWDVGAEGPCVRCAVRAVQVDGPFVLSLPATVRTAPDGAFALPGLAPGDYRIIAWRGRSGGVMAQRRTTVHNTDVSDVALPVGLVQPVSGEIVLEDSPDEVDPTGWTPHLSVTGLPPSWPDASGDVGQDLRFETGAVPPAEYHFEVLNLPSGAYLKALRVGGQRLAPPVLSVSGDAAVTGVQAVIAFDGASVSGRVLAEEPVEARVVLVPASDGSSYAEPLTAHTQSDGSFGFASLVPGIYTLYALPAASALQVLDPAVQATLRSSARTLSLKPGGSATVGLPLAAER